MFLTLKVRRICCKRKRKWPLKIENFKRKRESQITCQADERCEKLLFPFHCTLMIWDYVYVHTYIKMMRIHLFHSFLWEILSSETIYSSRMHFISIFNNFHLNPRVATKTFNFLWQPQTIKDITNHHEMSPPRGKRKRKREGKESISSLLLT